MKPDVKQFDAVTPPFWYGDEDGSLFEVRFDRATVTSRGDDRTLTLAGTAENLLDDPTGFRPEGVLSIGATGKPRRLTGGTSGEVKGHRSAPVRFTVSDVPADLDPRDAIVTFGKAGTNQAIVALDGSAPVGASAPREGFVDDAPFGVDPTTTMAVTDSVIYPRFVTGRAGQERLRLTIDVRVEADRDENGLYLHTSLSTPDGTTASMGDQNAVAPGGSFVETAVVNPPDTGTYTIEVLEVRTQAAATKRFEL